MAFIVFLLIINKNHEPQQKGYLEYQGLAPPRLGGSFSLYGSVPSISTFRFSRLYVLLNIIYLRNRKRLCIFISLHSCVKRELRFFFRYNAVSDWV
jgi:hypothetical protein